MKIAYHIWGTRVALFANLVAVPRTLFYTDSLGAGDNIGILVTGKVPAAEKPCGIQYKSNICTLPRGFLYNLYYGDVRTRINDRCIPVVCDIMDLNFWYYYRSLQLHGLFTFSVDSTYCDPDVYLRIIEVMTAESEVVAYKELL